MRRITQRDLIRAMRQRWLEQYKGWPDEHCFSDGEPIGPRRAALAKLDFEICSAADVKAAIGSDAWTDNKCDECHGIVETVVHIGDDKGYDMRWQCLCANCLRKALDLLAGERKEGAK